MRMKKKKYQSATELQMYDTRTVISVAKQN